MSMKLLILGLLMEKDRHPYDIRQTIKARNWDQTFRLRDGSLYYAVDQLLQNGMVEVAETIPVAGDNRPDKTIYRITEKGRASFLDMFYSQMEQDVYPQHPMFMALPFARHADNDHLEEIITKQLETCECRIDKIAAVLEIKREFLPRGAIHLIEGILRFSVTERDWLLDVLKDAKSGHLTDGATSPPKKD
jgi:DNA-binding PadR family transcriptional regulator